MGEALVSICIPNLDMEAYVGDAIASALAQSWSNLEVVVIDNHSTDGSWERICELAASGAVVVLASSDLPELLQLADRIVVLREGEAVGVLEAARASEADVVSLATGVDAG